MSVRILFIDIETAPFKAYAWNRFKENIGQTQVIDEGYVLCFAWCWNEDKKVCSIKIANKTACDKELMQTAWQLLDQADIVVGHNIRRFDLGTLNARFIKHGMNPPSPYKVVDTLEVAKRRLHIPSNSLESLSNYFNLDLDPKKKQTFDLWLGVLSGNAEAWKQMIQYCKHDTVLVRSLYYKLLPWIDRHPNMGIHNADGTKYACPNCGSHKIQRRGEHITTTLVYQRYQCQECGTWSREPKPLDRVRRNSLAHALVV